MLEDSLLGKTLSVGPLNIPLMPAVLAIILMIVCSCLLRKGSSKGGPRYTRREDTDDVLEIMRSVGSPVDLPCDEGTFVPSRGLVTNNTEEVCPFETDYLVGRALMMHRATYDKELDKTGEYRYGEYFLGKKRLWEVRLQWQFKQTPPSPKDIFFGIELEEYVPMNAATKRMMEVLVQTLKGAVGQQVYHTPGDDPARVTGPLERPGFVMPLYAFDQFIVTPPGEEVPSLMDPAMPKLGVCRVAEGVRKYKKLIEELEFKQGYTYTFNFWGISQWLDRLNWQVIMPVLRTRVDFNAFAGRPPVHVVVYTMKNEAVHQGDKRHLQFKKNYYIDLAFWSSLCRPSKEIVSGLFKGIERKFSKGPGRPQRQDGSRTKSQEVQQGFLSCCVSRPQYA